ncbi:hypothetical protein [Streptomyces seoulensis]|uniref:hypothetical protein n=1 Tax=Streptomyces seoulensis TaxID=73044 RepID=UPI001FCC00DD|nr:hypothetical protein [Streptomyces seoulensis]BDH08250.1 hypothetical protein HEK131_54770 [Streptomyces seoulensis]
MPDRSPRLLTFPPLPGLEGERGAVLLRERPTSPPQAPSGGRGDDDRGGDQQDDNPYAAPPEDRPDQPWRPRHPEGGSDDSRWGSQWSDRQPGRAPGSFGERPGSGPEGQSGGSGKQRWDPTDPAQRRARYALLAGMWAIFFVLLGWPYVSLLLGALALYWGGSSLRAKPRTPSPDEPAAPQGVRPQTTAAVAGMVTAALALVLVGAVFTVQLVYRDYYTCVNDALTQQSKQSCEQLLPQNLRGVLGSANS